VSATILRGDALALPIADESVDLIVTSPPYFGLRSYQDGGEHYEGQIGSEATPAEFVDALIAATREMVRVLKPSGSIWVNLGDKYASSGGHGQGATSQRATRSQYLEQVGRVERNITGIPTKSLIGIPWRYAIRCIDDLGLILRAEVIWSKPNGLPESVTDRVRRSHEQWFHFTREPRYFSAVDEIREASQQDRPQSRRAEVLAAKHGLTDAHREALRARGLGDTGRGAAVQDGTGKNTAEVLRLAAEADAALGGYAREFLLTGPVLGKLPGSVWTIATEPLRVPDHLGIDHFAAFPTEWPRRIITGWSPREVCTACGEGRRPVAESASAPVKPWAAEQQSAKKCRDEGPDNWAHSTLGTPARLRDRTITGYACACTDTSAPATPGVVLDPFGGTGTTALVADVLGRDGISVDLSADYCRLAQWRTTDPKQRAKAARVEAVEPVSDDQPDLFEEPA